MLWHLGSTEELGALPGTAAAIMPTLSINLAMGLALEMPGSIVSNELLDHSEFRIRCGLIATKIFDILFEG